MKILQINNRLFRGGGADVVCIDTAQLLSDNGHEVHYFSMSHPNNIHTEDNKYFISQRDYRNLSILSKIKSVPTFIYNKEAYNKLLVLIDKIKPDIAHVHLFMGGMTTSILKALKKRKIPVVHTAHDYRLICPAYLFMDGQNKICEKCIDKFYLRCAIKKCSEKKISQSLMLSMEACFRKFIIKPEHYIDTFIFVSQFALDKHVEFNPAYKPKSRLLYNCINNLDTITPSGKRGNYFLYFGRLSREKGIETLINAVMKTGFALKLAGIGTMFEKYRNINNEKIQFLGFKSGNELWELIRNAYFVIVPSEWYEVLGMVILESYMHYTPVIGANIGGIKEIIIDGKTGFLFYPGNTDQLIDAMNKATNLSLVQYLEMSKNARAYADSHFNSGDHYEQLMNIYTETILNYKRK